MWQSGSQARLIRLKTLARNISGSLSETDITGMDKAMKGAHLMARKPTTKIKSRPGLFGTTVHYDERGRKIGESRPGLFGDSVHYDANGKKVGTSREGFFGDRNHYDAKGKHMGKTQGGFFGDKIHRDADGKRVGKSRPSFWGGTDSEFDR